MYGIGEQNELTYSISDMHRDLILTVTNALVYNKKGSDVYNMALKLRAHITKLFEVILDSALQMIIVSRIMWWDGVVVCDFEGPDLYQKTSF